MPSEGQTAVGSGVRGGWPGLQKNWGLLSFYDHPRDFASVSKPVCEQAIEVDDFTLIIERVRAAGEYHVDGPPLHLKA